MLAVIAALVSVAGSVVGVQSPALAADTGPDRMGVVRAESGHWRWLIRTSAGGGIAQRNFVYGLDTDVPIWGDWNDDGVKTPGIFRNGQWLLKNTFSGGKADIEFAYGRGFDMPVVGDWDGNGTTGIGVVRGNAWLLKQNPGSGNADTEIGYGRTGDRPVHMFGPLPPPPAPPPPAGLTYRQLDDIFFDGTAPTSVNDVLATLNSAMDTGDISTPRRQAAFVANLIVESSLRYDAVEPRTGTCEGYDGGCDYRGRGFIQLTHRYNYQAAQDGLGGAPLVANPDLAAGAEWSPQIAVWFWDAKGLNAFADALDMDRITREVNGEGAPPETHQRRCDYFKQGMQVLTGSIPAGIRC